MQTFYLKDKNGCEVTCVVSDTLKNQRPDSLDNNLDKEHNAISIYFAIATHNPEDPYNRKIARKYALGRLQYAINTNRYTRFSLNRPVKVQLVSRIACDLSNPERTRKAAELWLTEYMRRTPVIPAPSKDVKFKIIPADKAIS